MFLIGFFGVLCTTSALSTTVDNANTTPEEAINSRYFTPIVGLIFFIVYMEDTIGQWGDCDEAQAL